MKRITITLDKSKKYLDKQRLIEDNNGVKRPIDGFYVKDINEKSSVNIVYFIANLDVSDGIENRRYIIIPMMEKCKRVKYINGEMIISICGYDYQIGTYTEV